MSKRLRSILCLVFLAMFLFTVGVTITAGSAKAGMCCLITDANKNIIGKGEEINGVCYCGLEYSTCELLCPTIP